MSNALQGFEFTDKEYYNFVTIFPETSGSRSYTRNFIQRTPRLFQRKEEAGISPDAFRENHTLVYGFPFAFFSYSLYLCTTLEERLHSTI